MDVFLRVKAWQLFVLMVVPLATFRFFGADLPPAYAGLMLFLFLVVASGWVFSVGLAANERLDSMLRMQTYIFKVCFVIPLLYLFLFYYFFVIPLGLGHLQRPPGWIVPLHFTAIGSIFYLLWFAAKQLVTMRENAEVSYAEYWLTFLGFWFGFVGVWFLQPKINAMFESSDG